MTSVSSLQAENFEILVESPLSEISKPSLKSELATHALHSQTLRPQDSRVSKLRFDSREEMEDVISQLEAEGVSWEFNQIFRADNQNQNIEADLSLYDPKLSDQWSLFNRTSIGEGQFAGTDVMALEAWNYTEGAGRLYVFDSGIDALNPELMDRVVAEFNAFTEEQGVGAAYDDNSHGTHVASISAGSRNGDGIMGIAPGQDVEVVAIKMLNANNSGDSFTAIRAFEWAREDIEAYLEQDPLHFVVINTSWGGPQFSGALQNAMRALASDRVLFVTSAGNDSQNNDNDGYWPCNFDIPHMLCTAASDQDDRLATFSSYGVQSVHLMAPGHQILGAIPGLIDSSGYYLSTYQDKSGTSQAAPHVAGAALLAWSMNPELSASDLKQILMESVDLLPGASDFVLSGGRLNVYRAVLMAAGLDPSEANREFQSLSSPRSSSCQLRAHTPTKAFVWFLIAIFFFWGMGRKRLLRKW